MVFQRSIFWKLSFFCFTFLVIFCLFFISKFSAQAAASPGDLVKCPDFSSVYYLAEDNNR